MPKIAAILLTTLSLSLCACASFDPYDGMAFSDFNHSAGLAGRGGAQLIGTNGNTEVYYLNGATDHNVFYWFDDGSLRKVTTGSLAKTKVALKTMYKAEHLKRAPRHGGTTTAVAGGGG